MSIDHENHVLPALWAVRDWARPRPIRTVRSGVVGIVGTAPDVGVQEFSVNTLVLIAGSGAEAVQRDTIGDGKGRCRAPWKEVCAVVVVIRVGEGQSLEDARVDILGGVDANTGQYLGVYALLGAKTVWRQVLSSSEFRRR